MTGRTPVRARRRSRRSRFRRRRVVAAAVLAIAAVGVAVVVSLPTRFNSTVLEFTLPLQHEDIIRQQARQKHTDAALIAAVIYAESRFRDQTSHAGARGLMQVQPQTALELARHSGARTFTLNDLSNPQVNISYGTYYLHQLIQQYQGNVVAALAAYNAGPTNADSWGGSKMVPDDIHSADTRAYVSEVLDKQRAYRSHYPKLLGYKG